MSRLDCVHVFRRVPPKCTRQARLTLGCCISVEHGDIAAEAHCLQRTLAAAAVPPIARWRSDAPPLPGGLLASDDLPYLAAGTGDVSWIGSGSVATATRGSHSSQLGRYQFQSPSSFMLAGSRTPRMIVASIRTAAAKPTPNCFNKSNDSVMKTEKTSTITIAALVTTPAVVLIPCSTASSVDMPWSTPSRMRLRMKTW